jgi:hypothetical protein
MFLDGLTCVDNDLGVDCDLVCGRVADSGKVKLVLGPGLRPAAVFRLSRYRFELFLYAVWICRLTELRNLAWRLIYLLSELMRGGSNFIGFSMGVGLCHGLDSLCKLMVGV